MKNILITGANGQLGNELQLLAKNYPAWNFFFTDVMNIDENTIFYLDITSQEDIEAFVSKHNINIIINCAAYTAVDKAESEPEKAHFLNAIAPGFLSLAIERKGGQMIQISTDYVFNGTSNMPYTEEAQPCPNSIYGRTKLAGEQAVIVNNPSGMIIRTAWLYSRFGNNFVKTMLRLGKEKEQLGVIFDQIGTPTYARDLAQVILTAVEKGIVPGIYHFSNEGVISWYDFTRTIFFLSNITTCSVKPLHTTEYPTPAQRPHYSVLDKTKIKNTYAIDIPWWKDSLAECIAILNQ